MAKPLPEMRPHMGLVCEASSAGAWRMGTQAQEWAGAPAQIQMTGWNRELWGVTLYTDGEELSLLGTAWHHVRAGDYPGEVCRCLLFVTRKQALAWCVAEMAKRKSCWRFRPVRVRETVKPI